MLERRLPIAVDCSVILLLLAVSACSSTVEIPVLEPEISDETFESVPQVGTPDLWDEVWAQVTRDKRHRVLLLDDGTRSLEARINLIRSARRSIKIQTFMWGNDETGRYVVWELLRAVKQRGVLVQIIADQMFSDVETEVLAYLSTIDPRLQVRVHTPTNSRLNPSTPEKLLALALGFRRVNSRMHDKVMVVDGRIAVAGGRNYFNDYFDRSLGMNYKDRDVLVIGPEVQAISRSFERFWASDWCVPSGQLTDVARAIERDKFPRFRTRTDFKFHHLFRSIDEQLAAPGHVKRVLIHPLRPVERVEWLYDEPKKPSRDRDSDGVGSAISERLRALVLQARESVVIQSPYLVLGRDGIQVFEQLRREHPEIRVAISTNSLAATDMWPAYAANYKQKRIYLQDLGFSVHEFKPIPQDIHLMLDYSTLLERRSTPAEKERGFEAKFRVDPALEPYPVAEEHGEVVLSDRRTNRHTGTPPYLCLHAKSLVVDDRIAFVGSHNLDPRSSNLNTEVGLLVHDAAFAQELRASIERDMAPRNSYLVSVRKSPLALRVANDILHRISELSPVDVWPARHATCYELRPGKEPVGVGDPSFHDCWRDVGSFPLLEKLDPTSICTRLFKAVGRVFTPLL